MDTRVPPSALVELLASTLGQAKAEAVVRDALADLRLEGPELTNEEAQSVLAHLTEVPGIVGTVARFAQVRFILLYPAD
jgi:hypothetical protein